MKKATISMLLALAMVFSLVLVAAPVAQAASAHPHADGAQTHCVCNSTATVKGHTHVTAPTWTAWPGIANVTEGGYYYLEKNETIEWPSETVSFNLCLNGYNITQSTHISVKDMTICDCAATPGTITSSFSDANDQGGIAYIVGGGTLNLFNANLVYTGTGVKTGGGVQIPVDATFNMYSGTISGGNVANKDGQSGGNVMVKGTFNMYGGKLSNSNTVKACKNGANIWSDGTIYITGNSVIENGYANYGGNIRLDGGEFTMDSGEIRGGKAVSAGGNMYVQNAVCVLKGTAVVKNGTAGTNGGNFMLQKSEVGGFTLEGDAKIIDGTATNGGNIFCHASNVSVFNMNGGTITGGSVKNGGAGIMKITAGYLQLAEDFATSKDVTIKAAKALTIDLNGKVLSGAVDAGDKLLKIIDTSAGATGKMEATVTGTLVPTTTPTPTPNPSTGDSANLVVMGLGLVLGVAGMACLLPKKQNV